MTSMCASYLAALRWLALNSTPPVMWKSSETTFIEPTGEFGWIWMAQGARVTGNLFHDNDEDLFAEVDHGPYVVDNNVFLSSNSQRIDSQGGAYLHNLFCGAFRVSQRDGRMTPFMKPHSTEIAGYHDNPRGDLRFCNNIFVGQSDLTTFNVTDFPMQLEGNVFLKEAKPCSKEASPLVSPEDDPGLQLIQMDDGLYLKVKVDEKWTSEQPHKLVTTATLGRAVVTGLPYERADGRPFRIDMDYMGKNRSDSNPTPGPFERPGQGELKFKVWRDES